MKTNLSVWHDSHFTIALDKMGIQIEYRIRPNYHTYPIGGQSNNFIVQVTAHVFVFTSLQKHMLWVHIWIVSTSPGNSYEYPQQMIYIYKDKQKQISRKHH